MASAGTCWCSFRSHGTLQSSSIRNIQKCRTVTIWRSWKPYGQSVRNTAVLGKKKAWMFSPVLKANAKKGKRAKTVILFWEGRSWVGRFRSCPWHSNYGHTKLKTLAAVSEGKKTQEANSFETISFWLWELGKLKKEVSWTTLFKLGLSQRSEREHNALRSFHPVKGKISAQFPSVILLVLHTHLSFLTGDLWSAAAL